MNKLIKNLWAGISLQKYKGVVLCMLCSMFLILGCGDKDDDAPLKGTNWKFVGILNVRTGELQELEPKDCEECLTLKFLTNKTAEVFLLDDLRPYIWDLRKLGKYKISKIGYPFEINKFINAIHSQHTKSYSVQSDELKFINKVDNYDVLFKKI